MDIEPVQPLGGSAWPKIVRRRTRDEDAQGRHGAFEDEEQQDEALEEDEEGNQHIDIRV